jgi:hypothetical protein
VTQARNLREAEAMARDYVASMLDLDPADVAVNFAGYSVTERLDREVSAARSAVRRASAVQVTAAEKSRKAARELVQAGLTGADAAAVMGVSAQRFSQLVNQ